MRQTFMRGVAHFGCDFFLTIVYSFATLSSQPESPSKDALEAEIFAAAANPDTLVLGVLSLGIEEKIKLLADILRKQEEPSEPSR
jgi:hypothetical protein